MFDYIAIVMKMMKMMMVVIVYLNIEILIDINNYYVLFLVIILFQMLKAFLE